MNITFFTAAIVASIPLVLATLGEIITERTGHLNLGVEGMMLIGAVAGFATGFITKNPILTMIVAGLAGAGGALIYAVLTVTLKTNQVVTGLALTMFGTGFSSFMGQRFIGEKLPNNIAEFYAPIKLPILGDIPVIGEIFFNQDIFVYFTFILVIVSAIYLYKTRMGLNLRAIGENPGAPDAVGIPVDRYKYVHILIGGAMCGLAGAYLSVIEVPQWTEGITAGRGWIAIALVIFSGWNPLKALVTALFFGGLSILGFRIQHLNISQHLLDMLPYLATLIMLVVASIRKSSTQKPPAYLGNAYFREER